MSSVDFDAGTPDDRPVPFEIRAHESAEFLRAVADGFCTLRAGEGGEQQARACQRGSA